MEKGIGNFFDYYKATFDIEHDNPGSYSPLSLAYVGDSIFDLMIRTMVVSRSNKQVQKYHDEVSKIVCASAQATMMRGIKDRLTEDEHAIYKRGRNANFNTKAKNASMTDYRNATAFEAVLGYLYLNEDFMRLSDIVKMALEVLQIENQDIDIVRMARPVDASDNAAPGNNSSDDDIDKEDINDNFSNSDSDEQAEYYELDKEDSKWADIEADDNNEVSDDDNTHVQEYNADSDTDNAQGYETDGSGD